MDHDMTLEPDTARLLRDWLRETADEVPDDPALLARVKASVGTPRPRPFGRPFRPATWRMLAVASMATVAVVTVGLAFRQPVPDGFPAVGAAPSSSPMPLPDGALPPGRYSFLPDAVPLLERYEVSLDVPTGWSNGNGGWVLTKGGDAPGGATVEVDVIERIMVDPCHPEDGWVGVPSDSLRDFAATITSWGSADGSRPPTAPATTDPVFGTFDGRPGVEITVQTRDDIVEASCTAGHYTLWGDAIGGRYIQGTGESFRIRAIDLGSELLFLAAGAFPETPAELLAEQQAMLDSVHIVPRPAPSSAPASTGPRAVLTTLPNVSSDDPPGRYRVNPRWHGLGDGSEVSVELMPGWSTWNSTIVDPTRSASLELWGIEGVFTDPCAREATIDGPWPSLEGFAGSIAAWSSGGPADPVVSVPRSVDLHGYPGVELTIGIPSDLDVSACAMDEYRLWRFIDKDVRRAVPGDELLVRVIADEPGSSGLLFIVATTRPGVSQETRAQLLAMVDSVRIAPAGPGVPASPAAP